MLQTFIFTVVAYAIILLFSHIRNGGLPGSVARDATFLYAELRRRHADWSEGAIRCLALYFASSAGRADFSEDDVVLLTAKSYGESWEDLCTAFTFLYLNMTAHKPVWTPQHMMAKQPIVAKQINRALHDPQKGRDHCAKYLDGISRQTMDAIIAKYEAYVATHRSDEEY